MARIVVAGAGVGGMASALMLAKDGHEVTVVERDAAPQPADPDGAWSGWERKGISQFRMGHLLLARGCQILTDRAPEVIDELLAQGALDISLRPPATMEAWTPRKDDQRFRMVTARRPVIDQAFANVIDRTEGVTIRRGVPLNGLHVIDEAAPGVPHVSGVTTDDEVIEADVVIDAMGRRSPMLRWLAAVGASAAHEKSVDSGFAYYGQYLTSDDGSLPEAKTSGLTPFHGYSILTLPADNGTWFYGVYASSNDAELRQLRDREKIHRLMQACPLHAQWLEGRELNDIVSMTGVADRDRRYVVDGRPVVTGMLPVADAWACTNPSLGRGMSIGIDHGRHLQDTLRDAPADPTELALLWDDVTETHLAPWHAATRATDQARSAELDLQRQGRDVEPDPDDIGLQIRTALGAAMPYDEECFRMYSEIFHILDLPSNVLGRPGAFEHLITASEGRSVPVPQGPTRAEFLEMIA